jgi:hypothetical protein
MPGSVEFKRTLQATVAGFGAFIVLITKRKGLVDWSGRSFFASFLPSEKSVLKKLKIKNWFQTESSYCFLIIT